jgi:molybdate transport system substrate-binding protein
MRVLSLLGAALLLIGCARPKTDLTIYAAASLREAFTELGGAFERQHPEVQVRFSFAGSQALRLQIAQGAPADVFASANPDHLETLARQGHVAHAARFARNALVVITPPDDPAGVRTFADLGRAQRVVLGAPEVPAGRYARAALAKAPAPLRAAVLAHVVSEEHNVRLVQAKVALGEADAALVYRTDAQAAGTRVRVVPIPAALNVQADYVHGAVVPGRQPALTDAWLAFVVSPAGQAILARHGFGPP